MTNIGVAVIGCGNIADDYVVDLKRYPEVALTGVTDINTERAQKFGRDFDVNVYPDTDALLNDPDVQVVVNLTPHHAHKPVTEQALQAGKHVYSEKPLALTSEDAWSLVRLAQAKNLRLACSPFAYMGEAQQTAWKWVRDGKPGKVRVVYAEVNWGRIETWHPAPVPFYEVGAMFDVGVYPLAMLTAMFGPVRRVSASGGVVLSDRVTRDGISFHLTTPDFMVAVLEMADGTQVRLTADFYVHSKNTRQNGIEFHGDSGSLLLDSFFMFDSPVWFSPVNQSPERVEPVREPYKGIPWGRGVLELVCALLEARPHRFTGEHAAHITDVLNAVHDSIKTGQAVTVNSEFTPPAPMEWAV